MPTPHKIAVDDLTANSVGTFKKLHQVLFPVEYPPSYFKDALNTTLTLSRLAYFNDVAVGCACVRMTLEKNGARCYMATLGVLAPYRRLGVGAKLLEHVEEYCRSIKAKEITLHVQDGNDAKEWYIARGYEEAGVDEKYYPRSDVKKAYLLRKSLQAQAHA